MDKCTICLNSRAVGEKPACVRNCTGGALHFGDVNDPESEVSKLLAATDEKYIFHLQDFDNHPSTRYILKNAEWQDILPQQLDEVSFGKGGIYYER